MATVPKSDDGGRGSGQNINGAIIGGVVAGLLFFTIVLVIVSLLLCYR